MDSDDLPTRWDPTICAGATWDDQLEIVDEDGESGLVSGSTAQIRVWNPYTNTLLLDFTTTNGKLDLDADAGLITIVTVASDTEALADLGVDELLAKVDARVTLPSGQMIVYAAGNATIYRGPPT